MLLFTLTEIDLPTSICPPGEWHCKTTGKCLSVSLYCDFVVNCDPADGGYDESCGESRISV